MLHERARYQVNVACAESALSVQSDGSWDLNAFTTDHCTVGSLFIGYVHKLQSW